MKQQNSLPYNLATLIGRKLFLSNNSKKALGLSLTVSVGSLIHSCLQGDKIR